MKTGVHLRLSQQLALTPQLQQSIRLLQLSTLELNQEIEQALHENPLLERDDDPLSGHLRLNTEGSVQLAASSGATPAANGAAEGETPAPAAEEGDFGGAESNSDDSGLWSAEGRGTGASASSDGEDSTEGPQSPTTTARSWACSSRPSTTTATSA
jgi:RNA polymerase sigma-54 factor